MSNVCEFAGTSRFHVLRKLGQGGMGIVYEAQDTERNLRVALKTLAFAKPAALYRFKQEFRSIAEIVHPNLISLYEFFAESDVWFFTMEFIAGSEFAAAVRSGSSDAFFELPLTPLNGPETLTADARTLLSSRAGPLGVATSGTMLPQTDPPGEPERVRALLRQVAGGLNAVHAAGKLHRDVKSSNVLVTPDDRAIVLDFGLAAEFDEANVESASGEIVGTVPYISPEQISGGSLSPATDWYSFGVMMFQALTGRMPFSGPAMEIMQKKRATEPPPASEFVRDLPPELNALCADLLRIEPRRRPSGAEVLARLGTPAGEAHTLSSPPQRSAHPAGLFVGREAEEHRLLEAFSAARSGTPAIALVHGPSGVGKSSLAHHFLEREELRDALILRGRCYEQESVPYKAFDSAIDALSRHLRRLDPDQLEELLPEDIGPLTQTFPVLREVQEISRRPRDLEEPADVQELRRRSFGAFRELMARLQKRQQVILCLDDLQWADIESGQVLNALLAPPNPPPVFLYCSFRSEYAGRSPFLQSLSSLEGKSSFLTYDVPLAPLGYAEALALADKALGVRDAAFAQRIAKESGGNPYFLLELARSSGENSLSVEVPGEFSRLDAMIWKRIAALPEDAQFLLHLVAVFGQPLAQADAYEAAGFRSLNPAPLSLLRYENLVRTAGSHEFDSVETFHDRVRETVLERVSPDRRRELHGRLAHTLERSNRADAETLAVHFEGAGEGERASDLYEVAAQKSGEALAFDHAAQLLESALRVSNRARQKNFTLQTKLADSLAKAGRGIRAAKEYEIAAQRALPEQQLDLERNAAFHYCSSGHFEEGLTIFERVLDRVGLRLSPRPQVAIRKFMYHSLRLHVRGHRFRERPPDEARRELLQRFDAAWAVAAPMSVVDLLEAFNFGTLCLLLALKSGDPFRLVRGTLVGAHLVAPQGRRGRRLAEQLYETSRDYAEKSGDPGLRASMKLTRGAISFMCGDWREARSSLLAAEQIFLRECPGSLWEMASLRTLYFYVLYYRGDLAELGQRTGPVLQEAEERQDLYTFSSVGVFCKPLLLLAADNPEEAREFSQRTLERWPYKGFHLQHVMRAQSQIWADFYEGRGAECFELVQQTYRLLHENFFHRHPSLNTLWQDHLGRSAIAVACSAQRSTRERADALRLARKTARRLAASNFPWAQAAGSVVHAGLALLRGDRQSSARLFLDAARRYDALDMFGYGASARLRAGELMGGREGQALVSQASDSMRLQNIVRPDRMAEAHVGDYAIDA